MDLIYQFYLNQYPEMNTNQPIYDTTVFKVQKSNMPDIVLVLFNQEIEMF